MSLPDWLHEAIQPALNGHTIQHTEKVGEQGDEKMVNLMYEDGSSAFLKWRDEETPPELFERSAEGFRMLREASGGAISVPDVYATGDRWILMENLKRGEDEAAAAEDLGRGLAAIHRTTSDYYGYEAYTFLGTMPQPNNRGDSWVAFYREHRLDHAMQRLGEEDHLTAERRRELEEVMERLDEWLPDTPPASLVHGHLTREAWMAKPGGQAVLVAPAIYYGHREVDLAMMALFDSPPQAFWEAYTEAYPLDDGYEARQPLYQLYYVMMHMVRGEDHGNKLDAILARYCG